MESPISNLQPSIINLQSSPFTFSQASLQAYVDCPRRFQLRYLHHLAWPSPEAQPVLEHEQHMQRGEAFHKLVQQYFLGIPAQKLDSSAAADPLLAGWWRDFQLENPVPNGYTKITEASLSIPIAEHRISARYDLLAAGKDDLIIFDWKTSKNKPKQDWLQESLQSRVYPYVLTQAGAQFNHGDPVEPQQVQMVYWFSNFPASPVRLSYSLEKTQEDEDYLTSLVNRIVASGEEDFPRTDNLNHCRYCVYRSFCDRGVEAGSVEDLESVYALEEGLVEDFDLDLDFDQIAEAEF